MYRSNPQIQELDIRICLLGKFVAKQKIISKNPDCDLLMKKAELIEEISKFDQAVLALVGSMRPNLKQKGEFSKKATNA